MISVDLAQRLRDAGLAWGPASGDRFVVADRGMDDEVFVISDMTVDVHDLPSGRVIGFNGTTEWALDSLRAEEVVWLPDEAHLREALGDQFSRLEAVPGGYVVVAVDGSGTEVRHVDIDAECAYARAVLARLEGPGGRGPATPA